MDKDELLIQRINLLEYHQKLLVQLLNNPTLEFNKLIIENGVTEMEVENFHSLCVKLSVKLEEQKAEGYVYFHPLFNELSDLVSEKLDINAVIKACLQQKLYEQLFSEFIKYI